MPIKKSKTPAPAMPKGFTRGAGESFRWVPEPFKLRPAGWKSVTFKDGDGQYLTMGAAIDACAAINTMIANWYDHGIRPAGKWSHLAPADLVPPAPVSADRKDAIGKLIDDWLASPGITSKKPRTIGDYKNRIHRMVETLAGHAAPPHRKELPLGLKEDEIRRYDADMARTRAYSVKVLLPAEDEETPPLQQVYNDQILAGAELGKAMVHNAKAVITTAHIWLEYVVKKRRLLAFNPAGAVECTTPGGRVVIWDEDEEAATQAAARQLGWISIGFAARLSKELSWSRGDVLALQLGQFHEDIAYAKGQAPRRMVRVEGSRLKTGNRTFTTLTQDGIALFDEIMAWHKDRLGKDTKLLPSHPILVVDDTPGHRSLGAAGKPWSGDYFAHRFAEVRDLAGEILGRPIDKRFADFRDSAITEMNAAKLTRHHKQSRSQHSLKSIDAMDEKHYGLVTPEISDEAADLIDAYRARKRAHRCEVDTQKTQN